MANINNAGQSPAVALISSFIYPHLDIPSIFPPEQRLDKTLKTIYSAIESGFSLIYLLEGSDESKLPLIAQAVGPMVTIVPIRAHQFNNKGITELFMIRAFLKGHTLSGPIVKISGRYSIDMNLADDLLGFDFAGRIYGKGNMRNISSRYYAVRDSGIYLNLIEESIREVFAFAGRLNGRTSLARLLKSSFNYKSDRYPYHDPPRGIEFAMSDAISNLHLKARWLPKIGCSGYVAGCNGLFINE